MLLVMGGIFFLSHQPGAELPQANLPGLDKAAHLAVYALLAATVIRAQPSHWQRFHPGRAVTLAIGVSLLYGCSDEWHQRFVPGRSAEWADLAADTGGAVLFCILWLLRRSRSG